MSVCLIAVTARLAYNVEGGMPLKYTPLLLPSVWSRAVTLAGCPVPLQLKCKGTGCWVCAVSPILLSYCAARGCCTPGTGPSAILYGCSIPFGLLHFCAATCSQRNTVLCFHIPCPAGRRKLSAVPAGQNEAVTWWQEMLWPCFGSR